jgi:hypothetical protein
VTIPGPYTGDPGGAYVGPDIYGGPQPQNLASGSTYANVVVQEAIGSTMDLLSIQTYVHLYTVDAHSSQVPTGYADYPLHSGGYTYERWFRVQFNPPFDAVYGFRFWTDNYAPGPGWTVLWGTSTTYQTPVITPSSIAVSALPTTDPGPAMPNCGGHTRLPGTGTQYSDWIVVQATADPAQASVGPVLGFTEEGTLIPITFNINWIED